MSKETWHDMVAHFNQMHQKGNIQAMQETLKMLSELSQYHKDLQMKITTHYLQGKFYQKQNDIRKAINSYEHGIELANDKLSELHTYLLQLIEGYEHLGLIELQNHNQEQGFEYLHKALDLAFKNQFTELRNKLLILIAKTKLKERQYQDSEALYTKIIQLGEEEIDPVMQLKGYAGMGKIHFIRSDTEQAESYFQKTEALLHQYPDTEEHLTLHANRIALLSQRFQYEEAIEQFIQIMPELESFGNLRLEAIGLNNIAIMCAYLGQYDAAMNYLDRARDLVMDTQDQAQAETILQTKSYCYFEMGELDRAISLLDQALTLNASSSIKINRVNILVNRGHIYCYKNQWKEAGRDIEEATAFGFSKDNYILKIRGTAASGTLLVNYGNVEDGIALIDRSLEIEGGAHYSIPKANAAELAGYALYQLDYPQLASQYYQKALDWYSHARILGGMKRCKTIMERFSTGTA